MFKNYFYTRGIKSTAKACCGLFNAYINKGGLNKDEAIHRVFTDRFKVSPTFRKNCNAINRNIFDTKNLNEVIFAITLFENTILAKYFGVIDSVEINYSSFYEKNIPIQEAVIDVIEKQTGLKYELMDEVSFGTKCKMIYLSTKY